MTIESSIWVILKTVLFSICLQDPGHVSYPLRFSLPEPSACATDNRLAEMQPSAHCRGHLKCCGALFQVEGRNYLQDGGAAMKSVYNPQSSCFALWRRQRHSRDIEACTCYFNNFFKSSYFPSWLHCFTFSGAVMVREDSFLAILIKKWYLFVEDTYNDGDLPRRPWNALCITKLSEPRKCWHCVLWGHTYSA